MKNSQVLVQLIETQQLIVLKSNAKSFSQTNQMKKVYEITTPFTIQVRQFKQCFIFVNFFIYSFNKFCQIHIFIVLTVWFKIYFNAKNRLQINLILIIIVFNLVLKSFIHCKLFWKTVYVNINEYKGVKSVYRGQLVLTFVCVVNVYTIN